MDADIILPLYVFLSEMKMLVRHLSLYKEQMNSVGK